MTDPWILYSGDPDAPPELGEVVPRCRALWGMGDRSVLDAPVRVAIIGSRRARPSSIAVARQLARAAGAAGATVVSGLAMGVDTAAHRGALDASGRTIAVFGAQLGRVHPRSNEQLAASILAPASRSAVVSEYGPGTDDPHPWQFRARNRIIAALSTYVLVVQAAQRSGSLGTAADALELGVPVGVVPGAIGDAAFGGSHALIRDGAECILDDDMLLAALGLDVESAVAHDPFGGSLAIPRTPTEIADLLGLQLADARRMLVDAELAGTVRRRADGLYQTER